MSAVLMLIYMAMRHGQTLADCSLEECFPVWVDRQGCLRSFPFQTEQWWFLKGFVSYQPFLTCRTIVRWFFSDHFECLSPSNIDSEGQFWSKFQKYLRENIFTGFRKNHKATWLLRLGQSCVSTANFLLRTCIDQQHEDMPSLANGAKRSLWSSWTYSGF